MIQNTTCLIVGGGPAGMMLGLLLARSGVEVTVLEKHADFFRDFRGDTIHPSTLEVIHELGLLERFLALPHQQYERLFVSINGRTYAGPDFSRLATRCRFMAIMPQWDFLNFLADCAKQYPTFHLAMETAATGIIEEGGRVVGARAEQHGRAMEIRADLVVAADGRRSTLSESAGMKAEEFGVPIDVLWYRVPKTGDEGLPVLGWINGARMMITIDRADYFQCGTLIRKGDFAEIRERGLEHFRAEVVSVAPFLAGGIDALEDWADLKLLTVQINRLRQWWRPGLLCIGDAAHAMSPAGGVGVNLAVQDAVATANILAEKLRAGSVTDHDLAAVEKRRRGAVQMMQGIQTMIHRRMFQVQSGAAQAIALPWIVRVLLPILAPFLRLAASRIVGMGFCPEHVRTIERGSTKA